MPKAIIVGSGIAGMAVAIRLAKKGYDVTVFEKNNYPGGKLSLLTLGDYKFDAGPSLFTQPQQIEELFALCGEPIAEYFLYQPIDIACNYFFENGKRVHAYVNKEKFATELSQKLNESTSAVQQYLDESKRMYDNIGQIFLNNSLHKLSTWLHKRVLKALYFTRLSYLIKNLHQLNSKRFTSPEAVQIFDRYATYNGSNPYKAPGMLGLIPHLEYNEGVFYPTGGMINITNALYKLALKMGVQFEFEKKVDRILHTDNKVSGVVVEGVSIYSDIVVSNMDVYFTYKNLLDNSTKAAKILKLQRSSSALVFYWGIKKQFPELSLHNIFFTKNYKEEFDSLFETKTLYNDPTIYINITSKMDADHAPEGCENWFVMINAPENIGQDWEDFRVRAKQNIIQKLNRILKTNVEDLIETESILDAPLIESKTNSYRGSLYGTSSNNPLSAFLRHPNFNSSLNGLYFCGGSVHPGGGIPLCLKSAQIVSELIN